MRGSAAISRIAASRSLLAIKSLLEFHVWIGNCFLGATTQLQSMS
jgi:cell division protein FtsB